MVHFRLRHLFVIGLVIGLSWPAHAAGNPDIGNLQKAKIIRFAGHEAVSTLFAFEIDVASSAPALNFMNVLGQSLTVAPVPGRVVNGLIESIEHVGRSGRSTIYRIRLVPTVAKLKYNITSRTFYQMTVSDIVSNILEGVGISAFEWRITGPLPPYEMVIQYQESDWGFVSRLLEERGIHYHFEPTSTGHKIVFSDNNAGFPLPPKGQLMLASKGNPRLQSFSLGQSLHAGTIRVNDYNWKNPTANLSSTATTPVFQYLREDVQPAGISVNDEAPWQAQRKLSERITQAQRCSGQSTYRHLRAGHRFTLTGHPRPDFNQEYVLTAVEHDGVDRGYRNTLTCLPSNFAYRPAQHTPRPSIAGVVPGIVVGPAGQQLYVDGHGRIRVRFPWWSSTVSNQGGQGDGGWIRVAQLAAGTGSTAMWLPEIGDEVLVAFEHGDPRRPVVIGSLYNAQDVPPAPLPGNKSMTVLRRRSVTGLKNEIIFDNAAGQELLAIQGGRRMNLHAGDDLTLQASKNLSFVGGNGVSVNSARQVLLKGNQTITLRSGKHYLTISPQGISASTTITTAAPPQSRMPRKKLLPSTGRRTPMRSIPPTR